MQLSQRHTSTYIFTDELHWKELSRDQSWSGFNAPPAKGLIGRAKQRDWVYNGDGVFPIQFPENMRSLFANQQVLNHRWLAASWKNWKNWKVRPWAEKGLKSFCRTCWNKLTCSILYCSNDSLCISRIWIVKWNGGSSECILAPVFFPFFCQTAPMEKRCRNSTCKSFHHIFLAKDVVDDPESGGTLLCFHLSMRLIFAQTRLCIPSAASDLTQLTMPWTGTKISSH